MQCFLWIADLSGTAVNSYFVLYYKRPFRIMICALRIAVKLHAETSKCSLYDLLLHAPNQKQSLN